MKTLAFHHEAAQKRTIRFKSRTMSLGLCTLVFGSTAAALGQPVITSQVSVPMFYRVRGTTNNSVPSGMALIPAGPFVMGDTFGEGGALPLHTNQISAFYMDKFDVTKALFDSVYSWATNHSYNFDYGALGKATNHPAHSMTWYDAVKWCNARSEQQGRVPAYYTDAAQTTVYRTGQTNVQNDWVKWSSGYRLPTEAEWEKAARGGLSGQRFPWGGHDFMGSGELLR